MNIEELIQKLNAPLPGFEIQQAMAPEHRALLSTQETLNFKKSAVLLLLYYKNERLHTLFIERPQGKDIHSGQLCFPGGKREPFDTSLQHTALRETQEELGIPPQSIQILKALTPLNIPVSEYLVYPFVGYSVEMPYFKPNPQEVANLIETPLSLFENSNNKETHTVIRDNKEIKIPYFNIFGNKLWGATAMIMNEFIAML